MRPTALFDFLQHSDKTIKPIKQIETRSASQRFIYMSVSKRQHNVCR